MRKNKRIELFGIEYEINQFSAVEAFDMIDAAEILEPLELLRDCSVIKYDGSKVKLDSSEAISREVKSVPSHLPPNMVLKVLMESVKKHNFGFLQEWKGIKIPNRFVADSKSVESTYLEPLISALINHKLATLKELEEYYSMQDAFAMFDGYLAKSLNEAYSNEAALEDAKSKRN